MRGKKGDLVKNVLGILLTVIGLAVFFIGLSKLYNAHVNQESENAKHTMEVIMKKIDALPADGSTQVVLQGFPGAENWYLVGWSKNSPDRPNKCFFNSCLCLCKDDKNHATNPESGINAESCQRNGFCRQLTLPPDVVYYYPELISGLFKVGVYLPAGSDGEGIAFDRVGVSCVRLAQNLFDFNVRKTSGNYEVRGHNDFSSRPLHCPGFRYTSS